MQYEKVEINSERWFDLTPLLNEKFRDIKGYEGHYQVSNYGRVKSLERTRSCHKSTRKVELKIIKNKSRCKPYQCVVLCKDNILKFYSIHRLVAETFLDKKDFKSMPDEDRNKVKIEKLFVNHKDENPQNNKAENLEWCTHKYNLNYGSCIKKISQKNSKRVKQYGLDGKHYVKRILLGI